MKTFEIISLGLAILLLSYSIAFAKWTIEEVYLPGFEDESNVIGLEAEIPLGLDFEKIHMLYYMGPYYGEKNLYLLVRDEQSWQVENICSNGKTEPDLGIASGKQNIGIFFEDWEEKGQTIIRFGKKEENRWTFEDIDSSDMYKLLIQGDNTGSFHLAYELIDEENKPTTFYAKKMGNSWYKETLSLYLYTFRLSRNYTPWVMGTMVEDYLPGLCYKESKGWSCEPLPADGLHYKDLAFDFNNQPSILISEFSSLHFTFFLLKKFEGEWLTEQISEPVDYYADIGYFGYNEDGAFVTYPAAEAVIMPDMIPYKPKLWVIKESTGWTPELVDQMPTGYDYGYIDPIRALVRGDKIGIIYWHNYIDIDDYEGHPSLRFAYEHGFFPGSDDDDIDDDDIDDDDIDDDIDDDNDTAGEKNEAGCGCIT